MSNDQSQKGIKPQSRPDVIPWWSYRNKMVERMKDNPNEKSLLETLFPPDRLSPIFERSDCDNQTDDYDDPTIASELFLFQSLFQIEYFFTSCA
jgi:hypothetical protein